jgi:hypothetical protein
MASWNDLTNTQTNQALVNYYRMKAAKEGQPYNVLNTAPVKEKKKKKKNKGGFLGGLYYATAKIGGGIVRGLKVFLILLLAARLI